MLSAESNPSFKPYPIGLHSIRTDSLFEMIASDTDCRFACSNPRHTSESSDLQGESNDVRRNFWFGSPIAFLSASLTKKTLGYREENENETQQSQF